MKWTATETENAWCEDQIDQNVGLFLPYLTPNVQAKWVKEVQYFATEK